METSVKIIAVPALEDNYIYFLTKGNQSVVIDPGEAKVALAYLKDKELVAILNTHHHSDHIGGNEELKKLGAPLIGPNDERIPGIDQSVKEGDHFTLLDESVEVIATPGHTDTHITFYMPGLGAAFTADCLFSAGCGKLFEGTPEQMHASLQKIAALPEETKLYFGHEYTRKNLEFARTIEPENMAIAKALAGLEVPTTPTTVAKEKEINVFLRAKNGEELGSLRERKEAFQG